MLWWGNDLSSFSLQIEILLFYFLMFGRDCCTHTTALRSFLPLSEASSLLSRWGLWVLEQNTGDCCGYFAEHIGQLESLGPRKEEKYTLWSTFWKPSFHSLWGLSILGILERGKKWLLDFIWSVFSSTWEIATEQGGVCQFEIYGTGEKSCLSRQCWWCLPVRDEAPTFSQHMNAISSLDLRFVPPPYD